MAIQDDFTIDYGAKTVTHTAGTTVYTVNALYSWLQDTFDEAAQMDDLVPMSAQTPNAYSIINGWSIPDASYQYLNDGAIDDTTADNLWANIYSLGSIETGAQVYIAQNGALLTTYWGTDHVDLLIKVKSAGTLIDNGDLTLYIRDFGDLYSHFTLDASAGGRNAVPLATATDLNNQTLEATVSGYSDISITFGTQAKDLNNGNGAVNYDVVIDCATRPLSEVYEYLKYVTREGETALQNAIQGQLYISANPATYTAVVASPFGTFAGGTFFGARGVWIENYAAGDAKNFQLIDASGTTQNPPNTVPVQVTGLVVGDRVGVFVLTAPAGSIDKTQYTLNGVHNGIGTVTVNEAIGSDTPASGVVRIEESLYAYDSWTGSVFTLSGVTGSHSSGVGVYVPLIDESASAAAASSLLIYAADIPVLVRVRKKGILPFEVESTVTNTGLSVAAIRTTDNIVT